jgi:hypothetical protein
MALSGLQSSVPCRKLSSSPSTLMPSPLPACSYRFGRFRLDPASRVLDCDGTVVSLAPRTFDLLHTLVRSGGRLLTKGELHYDIYVKATGAEEPHRLTSNPARDGSPAWSPDGTGSPSSVTSRGDPKCTSEGTSADAIRLLHHERRQSPGRTRWRASGVHLGSERPSRDLGGRLGRQATSAPDLSRGSRSPAVVAGRKDDPVRLCPEGWE